MKMKRIRRSQSISAAEILEEGGWVPLEMHSDRKRCVSFERAAWRAEKRCQKPIAQDQMPRRARKVCGVLPRRGYRISLALWIKPAGYIAEPVADYSVGRPISQ